MTDFAVFAQQIIDELTTCRNYAHSISKLKKAELFRNKTSFG